MKTRWKSLMVAVCSMMIISTTAYAINKNVLVGNTRFETATEVSEYGFEQSSNIVLVNGESIADALSATPFAKLKEAPILLTEKDRLTDVTKSEIKRLKASNIYIVGGKGVVSDNVVSELKKIGYNVYRIYGETRYETSLNVAREIDKIKSVSEVAVVNGYNGLADALSVASPAAIRNMPIILSSKDELGVAEKWINSKSITKSYIIGGEGVISRYLESNIKNPQRLYGVNRWKTNARVLEHFFNQTELYNIYLAKDGASRASELVDALAAGPVAAKQNSPVMLVGNNLDPWQEEYLKPRNTKAITQVGGGVSINAVDGVVKALNFKEVDPTEVSYIDYLNCQQIEVFFGSPINKDSVIQNGKLRKDAIEISARDNSVEGEITGLDEFSARLEENNKKLVITRDLSTAKIFNGTYTIRVTDKVKTEKGYSMEPYVIELQIRDTVRPQVKNVVYDDVYGNLSISFTKPMKNFPVITLDGKKVTEDNNVEFAETRDTIILKREKLNELESIGKTVQVVVSGGTDYRNLEMIRYAGSLRLMKPGEERKVEEVKVKNAKEFIVTFASPVDQTTVVDANGKILKSNIKITSEGSGHNTNSQIVSSDELYGTFSPDKRTLTVKREFNNDKNFNGQYRVVITNNVKTSDGVEFVPYDNTVTLHDNVNPEVISTTYDSVNGVVKIMFSEPLKTKPTITIKGGLLGNKPAEEFNTSSELQLNETNRSLVTISYNALKIHRLVDTDYPDGATYKLTIRSATDFKDNMQLDGQYVDRDIHIKPIYEGFKVDKVVELNTDNKPGINEYLVYFNEKIFRPSVDNFSIEGVAEKASDAMLVTNPETNVSDQKVVKVVFGNGYINKGNTVTGLADQTLVVKDVKAQSGAVLPENVANVTVRDNTAPKLISTTIKDDEDDNSKIKITFKFDEKLNLKSDSKILTSDTLVQTFEFTSNMEYLDVNGKVQKVSLSNNALTGFVKADYDVDSITYTFNKDATIICGSPSELNGINQLISGKDLKVKTNNIPAFEDANGVVYKGNKDDNEALDANSKTSLDVGRENVYVGYISKYDPNEGVAGDVEYNVWFSEAVNVYGANIEVAYDDTKVPASNILYHVDDKVKNVGRISFKRNSLDFGGVGNKREIASMKLMNIYASAGRKSLANVAISDVLLRDNMETKLLGATFSYGSKTLTLDFSNPVSIKSVEDYIQNSIKIASGSSVLSKYPTVKKSSNASSVKSVTITFDLENYSSESKNTDRDEFLSFIINGGDNLKVVTSASTTTNVVKDTRGWAIKAGESIDLKGTKLEYATNVENQSDTELQKIEYKYSEKDNTDKLIFTFNGDVNEDSVKEGWFNTVKINAGSSRLINYPAVSSSTKNENEVTLVFTSKTVDIINFRNFMTSNKIFKAVTGYYPMRNNSSKDNLSNDSLLRYNLIVDTNINIIKSGINVPVTVTNLDPPDVP